MRTPALIALVFSAGATAVEYVPVHIPSLTAQQAATCQLQSYDLYGNYAAVQRHAYKPQCLLKTSSHAQSPQLVPIGLRSVGPQSRVTYEKDSSILLRLGGANDNTLNGGRRGRQEVADCFVSEQAFNALPSEERDFRFAASDVYRHCPQASGRYAGYVFDLRLEDTPLAPAFTWDAIVMQLHNVDDRDRYCMPRNPADAARCDKHTGVIGQSPRTAQAYNALLNNGAVFEQGVQPALSFRLKAGYFSIVATSSLRDSKNEITRFRTQQPCVGPVNELQVNQVKHCADSGKTLTVLYRERMVNILPVHQYRRFRVQVKWPTEADLASSVRVELLDTNNKVLKVLVQNDTVPISSIDDQFPYFKAGIYRLNHNAVPTNVRIANLRKVQHYQAPDALSIHQWGANDRFGVVGSVFEYANPYNRDTEYFQLKALGADGRYGYFPTNKTSNAHWTYLGTARTWGDNGRKAPIGSIFLYRNATTGLSEFYQLKAVASDNTYWYFPTNETDNENWTYLGSR